MSVVVVNPKRAARVIVVGGGKTVSARDTRSTAVVVDRPSTVAAIEERTTATVGVNSPGVQGPPGGPAGPQGPQGERGKDGQIRFTGNGPPPTVIVGAQPGDTYMDLVTGDVYKLV